VKRNNQGFTLIEVMVALVIFALLASTIAVSNTQSLRSTRQINEQIQGRWVNQNVLTQMRLEKKLPQAGTTSTPYEYNNQKWVVKVEVNNVEMELLGPFLRRVQLRAHLNDDETAADVLDALIGEAGGS